MTTLFIDGDVFLFKACAAVETTVKWDDDLWTTWSEEKEARRVFWAQIHALEKNLGATKSRIAFSGEGNWRKSVMPDYKSHRVGRKPLAYKAIKDSLIAEGLAVAYPLLEGDDVIGIWGSSEDGIVVTTDKDLKTVPCTLFNPDKDTRPREIGLAEADRFHRLQALMGDKTDGYPGCKGIGEVTGGKILTKDDSWDAVVRTYEDVAVKAWEKGGAVQPYQGIQERALQDAEMNAKVARICRDGDWDAEKGEMTWTMD